MYNVLAENRRTIVVPIMGELTATLNVKRITTGRIDRIHLWLSSLPPDWQYQVLSVMELADGTHSKRGGFSGGKTPLGPVLVRIERGQHLCFWTTPAWFISLEFKGPENLWYSKVYRENFPCFVPAHVARAS